MTDKAFLRIVVSFVVLHNQRRVHLYALLTFSFRKCCITNALDGTEDDEIWEEELSLIHI